MIIEMFDVKFVLFSTVMTMVPDWTDAEVIKVESVLSICLLKSFVISGVLALADDTLNWFENDEVTVSFCGPRFNRTPPGV